MRIQFLGGGLANQIRQYVFLRYAQRRAPQRTWLLDDTWFFADKAFVNSYELEKVFGIRANLASRYFDHNTWETIVQLKRKGVFLAQVFLDAGISTVLVEGSTLHGFFSGATIANSGELSNIWDLPYSNIYYFDFWVRDDWFEQDQEENRKELAFPPLTDLRNLKYADLIQRSMSIGIHIRRGDFVKIGWAVPEAEYLRACRETLSRFPDASFFVFSDELDWCKAHAKDLGLDLSEHTVYVEGNINGKDYIDMQLLSMCRGIIRPAQSSFSQVAAWLDKDLLFERKLGRIFK